MKSWFLHLVSQLLLQIFRFLFIAIISCCLKHIWMWERYLRFSQRNYIDALLMCWLSAVVSCLDGNKIFYTIHVLRSLQNLKLKLAPKQKCKYPGFSSWWDKTFPYLYMMCFVIKATNSIFSVVCFLCSGMWRYASKYYVQMCGDFIVMNDKISIITYDVFCNLGK